MELPMRMKVDYKNYLLDDFSLYDGRDKTGFNNIVFHTELVLGKMLKNNLKPIDIEIYKNHLYSQQDQHGLYKPKNSHDNMTSKLVGCYMLGLNDIMRQMSWWEMVKKTHILRIWDTIFYTAFKGPKTLKWVAKQLLFITSFQILHAIWVKGKTRPKLHERIWWTLTGKEYKLRHYQNDGKILGMMKLIAMKKLGKAPFLDKANKMYVEKLGKNYGYPMFHIYFNDKDHPVIKEWKDIEEPLKC